MPAKNMAQRLAEGRAEVCFMIIIYVRLERLVDATVPSTQTLRHYNGDAFFVMPIFLKPYVSTGPSGI